MSKVICETDENGRVVYQVEVADPGDLPYFDGIEFEPCYIKDGVRVKRPAAPSPYHEWDWVLKEWVLTLQAAKDAKWSTIKAWRDSRNNAPLTWGDWTFDADEQSKARIAEAGLEALFVASQGETLSYQWVLADKTTATLSEQQMLLMSRALRTRTNQLHLAANVKWQQIEAATTVAQVEAIGLPPDPT